MSIQLTGLIHHSIRIPKGFINEDPRTSFIQSLRVLFHRYIGTYISFELLSRSWPAAWSGAGGLMVWDRSRVNVRETP